MTNRLRTLVLDVLPTAANIGLIAYLTWQLNLMPFVERQGEFRIFSVLYAAGGLVIAVAGLAAFVHGAGERDHPRRRMLALVNLIVPTVLLLVLLKFR